ncbi:MAG: FtsX-like permease family protein [Spirochaetota bacterium]|nr:FtsX-like permease family protein [Spirochaetota bacterium]
MRYLLRNVLLISRDIIKNIPRTLLSGFGVIFLISFLVLSISLKRSVKDFLEKRIFGQIQINQIKITPINKTKFINFSTSRNIISEKRIEKIRGIDGIENLYKVIRLNSPASLKAGMFGKYLRVDMLISGVNNTFFKGTNPKWEKFVAGDHVPIVIPMFAMNLYNNFAAVNGLPELGEKALKLFSMELIIGKSTFIKTGNKEFRYKAKIFGFTPSIITAGIIVPTSFIKDFCKTCSDELALKNECFSSIMLIANVSDIDKIPLITNKIRSMDLKVESQMDIADKTEKAVFLMDVTLSLIMTIMLILTILAIFNSYLAISYNRSHRFSIQRILGATKLRIVMTFVIEAGLIGIFYGIMGYILGYYLLNYMSDNIARWVPMLKGMNLRLENHNLMFMSLTLAAIVSSISALFPAIIASNKQLFNDMKK